MTEQSPRAHDARPAWLIKVQAPGSAQGNLDVDGTPYTYTIVRAGLAPGLPYSVGFPTEAALMVSEDTPEEYRPFVLSHEIREKTRFAALPEEDRCRAALEAELEDVRVQAPDIYSTYLADRKAFFDALVSLYEQPEQAAAVTPEFIQGIQASRDFLNNTIE
jgi:hypothetical protein